MLANSLATYIASLPAIGDTPVRISFLEATAPRGIIVMPPLTGMQTVGEIEGYYAGNMQVLVRDSDPLWGYNMAVTLTDALQVIGTPLEVEGYKITLMRSRGEPISYPLNAAALYEHSVNFNTRAYRL